MHLIFYWYILLIISWQDYENAYAREDYHSLAHIREKLVGFLMSEVLSPKGEFHYSRSRRWTPIIKDFVLEYDSYIVLL